MFTFTTAVIVYELSQLGSIKEICRSLIQANIYLSFLNDFIRLDKVKFADNIAPIR